ncbi:MAG: hypothetical protein IPI77_17250 [Saprospiraceae bacterium]|nr:hypothetical protein [Saprospiraceae bacterium]
MSVSPVPSGLYEYRHWSLWYALLSQIRDVAKSQKIISLLPAASPQINVNPKAGTEIKQNHFATRLAANLASV